MTEGGIASGGPIAKGAERAETPLAAVGPAHTSLTIPTPPRHGERAGAGIHCARTIYDRFLGPRNDAFTLGRTRFVLLDTNVDLFVGWVPESVGGHDILSTTAKVSFAPWRLRAAPRWNMVPLTAGLQATYTFGSQYFVEAPGRYPDGYYDLPTALDLGASLGGAVLHEHRGLDREVGLYYEVVALGEELLRWRENPRTIDATDVLSVALGVLFRF